MRSHLRLAYGLILIGMGFIALDRLLPNLHGPIVDYALHSSFVIGMLALLPVLFIASGGLVFMVGSMRRRR